MIHLAPLIEDAHESGEYGPLEDYLEENGRPREESRIWAIVNGEPQKFLATGYFVNCTTTFSGHFPRGFRAAFSFLARISFDGRPSRETDHRTGSAEHG